MNHEALGQHLGCANRDQLADLEWCKQTEPGRLTRPGRYIGCVTRDRPGDGDRIFLDNFILYMMPWHWYIWPQTPSHHVNSTFFTMPFSRFMNYGFAFWSTWFSQDHFWHDWNRAVNWSLVESEVVHNWRPWLHFCMNLLLAVSTAVKSRSSQTPHLCWLLRGPILCRPSGNIHNCSWLKWLCLARKIS